jgi:hypothetical protein
MNIKYTKWPYYIPNGLKIFQHFPFYVCKAPPQFTQIRIWGLKIYHLATQLFSAVTFLFLPEVKEKLGT